GDGGGRGFAVLARFLLRFPQLAAARLAAPTGVDLRLDDEQRRTEIARSLDRLVDRKSRMPARHRHAEFPQHRLGLIFVDVHADLYVSRMQRMQTTLRSARKFDCSAPLGRSVAAPSSATLTLLTSPDAVRSSCRPGPALRPPRRTVQTWRVRCRSTESRRCARRPWRRSRRARRHKGSCARHPACDRAREEGRASCPLIKSPPKRPRLPPPREKPAPACAGL